MQHSPDLALSYITVANIISNSQLNAKVHQYETELSEKERQKATERAHEWEFRWAKGPNTYLSVGAKWCEIEGFWNTPCLVNALLDHEACVTPFFGYGFNKPTAFPGYSKCRYKESMFPITQPTF